jgi:hypothetical protein
MPCPVGSLLVKKSLFVINSFICAKKKEKKKEKKGEATILFLL